MSRLYVVGTGPGGVDHMTLEAQRAIESCGVIVGYKTYLDLIAPMLAGKELVSSGMRQEVARCRDAIARAADGVDVALISGGDAGIYGMAGVVLELAEQSPDPPEVIVIPGVSAVQAAAALLGAPLMHDFAVISLSDLLTPWELIRKRLAAAAAADFVIALYNPKSAGRTTQLAEAREIVMAERGGATPVGIVRNAFRKNQEKTVTTLLELPDHAVDMFSLVMIGNSATRVDSAGRMVTPRGYETGSRPGGRSLPEPGHIGKGEHVKPEVIRGKSLMFCGTGSDVGKSVLAAGFCRILANRGIRVAPFKSQNMALNSAVTPEGGEIGRAQAVQAEACRIPPHTDMNPVLLKPSSDTGSQVIIHGSAVGHMRVAEYNAFKPKAFEKARESFARLRSAYDCIVIEGAGSIAEINLRRHDIANLKVAKMAGAPVIVVADIDRGGVFAQIVGTIELLEPAERQMIAGVLINKFRGDPSLLGPGIEEVERRTGVPVLGVVPWFSGFRLPEEDSVALQRRAKVLRIRPRREKLAIGVIRLPRISNYTDFDPLENEPDVALHYVERSEQLENLDLLIIPGSKSTIADLNHLAESGLADAIRSFRGEIVGICGGYQMLGKLVLDPDSVESEIRHAEGLGLIDAATVMQPAKHTHQTVATLLDAGREFAPCRSGVLKGYEIHMGETVIGEGLRPFARINSRSGEKADSLDGAVSPDGRIMGTYIHGIFENAGFRAAMLNRIRRQKGLSTVTPVTTDIDPLELLAAHLEKHLEIPRILRLCGLAG
ncbi:cobyric acid synthase [Geobacter sp. OR-1]|uniref:cobyric acid synthase n=1 Tax=Geobacter sp. OR-1 TaxID=1266765 RepID=UPI00054365C5|nr:cobyric acid synthase [Geobacter sp. OR-1]GAM09621.1 cobyric acid synthase [Geobacter sp. OR-1]